MKDQVAKSVTRGCYTASVTCYTRVADESCLPWTKKLSPTTCVVSLDMDPWLLFHGFPAIAKFSVFCQSLSACSPPPLFQSSDGSPCTSVTFAHRSDPQSKDTHELLHVFQSPQPPCSRKHIQIILEAVEITIHHLRSSKRRLTIR